MDNWVELVVAVLSGLVTAIPLVVKLVQYVQKAVQEKNWDRLVSLTIDYMTTAEQMFSNGAAKKDWVLSMIQSSAQSINYELDEVALANLSSLIDSFCDAAKTINSAGKAE